MNLSTALQALGGGLLIGAGVAVLLLLNGRIAGVSGIVASVLRSEIGEQGWRIAFLAGLPVPALLLGVGQPLLPTSAAMAITAGFLVGIGTRLGSGCTSGHGVCGLANLSRRSLAATAMFVLTAMVTVFVVRHGVLP